MLALKVFVLLSLGIDDPVSLIESLYRGKAFPASVYDSVSSEEVLPVSM